MPHWMPPLVPPLPTRVCQSTSPFLSGSSANTIPDFCPASSTSPPPGRVVRIVEAAKSKSGPGPSGQLADFEGQAPLKMSPLLNCLDHAIRPDARSRAMIAALVLDAGTE